MGLEIIDLTSEVFDYQNQEMKRILDAISVHVHADEITAVIGKIGSGKSTFVQHLNGLKQANSGKIFIHQQEQMHQSREWLRRVGIVLQFSQQQLFLSTVHDELAYAAINFGNQFDVTELCKIIGLDPELLSRHPRQLSGGQMKKVAIGSVLAAQPEILILDEPFAGLDWEAQAELIELLQRLKISGVLIIIVTHDLRFVFESCDRVLVFERGAIIADETPKHLFSDQQACEQLGIELPRLLQTQAFHELSKRAIDVWRQEGKR